jgi:hypothetical protein
MYSNDTKRIPVPFNNYFLSDGKRANKNYFQRTHFWIIGFIKVFIFITKAKEMLNEFVLINLNSKGLRINANSNDKWDKGHLNLYSLERLFFTRLEKELKPEQ